MSQARYDMNSTVALSCGDRRVHQPESYRACIPGLFSPQTSLVLDAGQISLLAKTDRTDRCSQAASTEPRIESFECVPGACA